MTGVSPSFKTSSELDLWGEPGDLSTPFLFDDGRLCEQPLSDFKALTDVSADTQLGAFTIFGEKRVHYRFAVPDAPLEAPVPWIDYPAITKRDLLVNECKERLGACKACREWTLPEGHGEQSRRFVTESFMSAPPVVKPVNPFGMTTSLNNVLANDNTHAAPLAPTPLSTTSTSPVSVKCFKRSLSRSSHDVIDLDDDDVAMPPPQIAKMIKKEEADKEEQHMLEVERDQVTWRACLSSVNGQGMSLQVGLFSRRPIWGEGVCQKPTCCH
eukprot:1395099-Amphidinium_carterae.1